MTRLFSFAVAAALLASACGGGTATPSTASATAATAAVKAPASVVIAYQPGIGYAQLLIMRQDKWIEADFPNTKVEYKVFTSGAVIRDGIIANQIQVGSGGVAPFLVGWAKGVEWKLLAGLNNMDLWLNVRDPAITSLKDIKPGMKIALPALDSIQAVALKRGAETELGDAKRLDTNLVALGHPEGVQNLTSGAIQGHLTSPPFQFQEVDKGARTIFKSYDAFGPTTFNSVFASTKFYDEYPQFAQKLYDYVQRATDLIKNDLVRAAGIVAAADNRPDAVAEYKDWMTRPGVEYTMKPSGFLKYAEFMKKIEMIGKTPKNIDELLLPPLQKLGGS